MKKSRLALLLVPLFLPVFVFAEKIDSFDTVVAVQPDSLIKVSETIVYDFEGASKHGIFRDIPVEYTTDLGNQSAHISDITVVDEKGARYQFSTSKQGNNEQIKIGDPDVLITGVHTYKINYTVERAIGYFDSYDEIYWNATGNGWQVPILASSAKVILPTAVTLDTLKTSCYYGPLGSKTTCTSDLLTSKRSSFENISFAVLTRLEPGSGLTVAVGFPKGLVHEPSTTEKVANFLKDNLILFLPFLVFAVMFYIWWKKGRDPKGSGVIVAEYEAPDNLTPLEMTGILHTNLGSKEISAEIIYLATRGYLHITRTEEKKFLIKSTDYEITLLKSTDDVGNDFDAKLIDGLFIIPKVGMKVKLSELKQRFYLQVKPIQNSVYDTLTANGYYTKNPQSVLKPFLGIPVLLFFIVYVGAQIPSGAIFRLFGNVSVLEFIFVIVVSIIIIIGFGLLMPKKTEKGAIAKDKILGLKEYLQIAEKDRINFHNAPEKNPQLFEKLLPYAMILGVEKAWAKEFEGIYATEPTWYSDPSGRGMFNALYLSNSLGDFRSSAATTLASAPGGHSGSGGGGFSGGGGGGGGGGSW